MCSISYYCKEITVKTLHMGVPGQITWLEYPPPCLLLCFGIRLVQTISKWRKCITFQSLINFFSLFIAQPVQYVQCKSVRSLRKDDEPFAASGTPGDLTWLLDFLTSKSPGSFNALAPPLDNCTRNINNNSLTVLPYRLCRCFI